ncbi:C39 family peptidase [Companilactobacillus mishanensis]|uniref:Peptidase C39-like domain-containing protein n=1 Tax=Companilactobacillus mishanensis TaxID=2486008 RepID=A0ABW9P9I2_9LACO|nr:C39 family peptidase [Companilactobacillus mishanensis]MQS45517.1 hypothetical protein [Companilactobacillus mishanensis]
MKRTIKYAVSAGILFSLGIFSIPSIVHADQAQQTTSESGEVTNVTPATTDVDGVFTVGDQTAPLTDATGVSTSNRSLSPDSAWYTDKLATSSTGNTYYRVSTEEYVNSTAGVFTSNVSNYDATASIVYKKGASVHTFNNYGDNASYTGNNVDTDTTWKIDKKANKNGKNWYEIGNNVWVPQDYLVVENAPDMKSADWISGVPMISQRPELPNGCEITAVTMMLQYGGANVNKMQLAQEMPRSSDPNYGYIGQPWDNTGITIFPSALMNLVEKYAGSAKDLTGSNLDAIKYQINIGHPVVTWNTLHGFPYHALVVTGYDSQYVYYNDCWTNQTTRMDINTFVANWNTQSRRAISY